MATRTIAIVLCLAALAPGERAQAQNDPACAQYQEPMAYNACLARHGPKANDVRTHSGKIRAYSREAQAPRPASRGWPHAQRLHGRVHMEFRVR